MALRQIDVYVADNHDSATLFEEERAVLDVWEVELLGGRKMIRVLLDVEESAAVLNRLEKHFEENDAFRIVLQPVEATLPRPPVQEQLGHGLRGITRNRVSRISREELYEDIKDTIDMSPVYVVMVALATIVAAGGLLNDSAAVVIGAMVIAPLLGPNMALALATTLGDFTLAKKALWVNLVGLCTGLFLSVLIGFVIPVDLGLSSIASRTDVVLSDVLLALAAGVAGALSFTRGVQGAVIGVMVAVALLPPLVVFGLLLGGGAFAPALKASLVVLINVAAVNLAGVVTFLVQGIRPPQWRKAKKAKKVTWVAVAVWFALLLILALTIGLGR